MFRFRVLPNSAPTAPAANVASSLSTASPASPAAETGALPLDQRLAMGMKAYLAGDRQVALRILQACQVVAPADPRILSIIRRITLEIPALLSPWPAGIARSSRFLRAKGIGWACLAALSRALGSAPAAEAVE